MVDSRKDLYQSRSRQHGDIIYYLQFVSKPSFRVSYSEDSTKMNYTPIMTVVIISVNSV